MNLKQLFHATKTIGKHANEREFPPDAAIRLRT